MHNWISTDIPPHHTHFFITYPSQQMFTVIKTGRWSPQDVLRERESEQSGEEEREERERESQTDSTLPAGSPTQGSNP